MNVKFASRVRDGGGDGFGDGGRHKKVVAFSVTQELLRFSFRR